MNKIIELDGCIILGKVYKKEIINIDKKYITVNVDNVRKIKYPTKSLLNKSGAPCFMLELDKNGNILYSGFSVESMEAINNINGF